MRNGVEASEAGTERAYEGKEKEVGSKTEQGKLLGCQGNKLEKVWPLLSTMALAFTQTA